MLEADPKSVRGFGGEFLLTGPDPGDGIRAELFAGALPRLRSRIPEYVLRRPALAGSFKTSSHPFPYLRTRHQFAGLDVFNYIRTDRGFKTFRDLGRRLFQAGAHPHHALDRKRT